MSDRDEWRNAATTTPTDCYRHHWVPNHQGGGTCTGCGSTVDAEEIS